MTNNLVNKYREQILNLVDICTTEDIQYFNSENAVYKIIDTLNINDDRLFMVVTDEKFNAMEDLINKLIPIMQPSMNKLHHSGEINDTVMEKYLRILPALLKVGSLPEIVKSSFSSTEELIERYGYTKEDEVNYDSYIDNAIDVLKERVNNEIKPLCVTVNLDVNDSEEGATAYVNNLVDNLSTIISSCESHIVKKDKQIGNLTEELETSTKEIAKIKQANLDNIKKVEEYKDKISELKADYREKSNEELDIALDKISRLQRMLKSKDEEIELLKSHPQVQQEVMTASDIKDVANYLYEMDSTTIKSILLQFLGNVTIDEKIKTPFILEVFTYIANMNGGV